MPRAALSQTITQKTVLSQQLRQSVELLQLSGPELQRELEVQLLSNPLLKLDEESSAAETPIKSEGLPAQQAPEAGVAHDFREPNYLTWRGTAPETEDFDPYGAIGSQETLSDYLLHQLGCLRLAKDLRMRCAWIIGNLDDEGFLSDSLEELARDGAQVIGVTEDLYAWQEALRLVQGLDPAGIAADGPTQSLLIQLSRLEVSEEERTIASALLTGMPEALAKRDHKAAARALGVTVEKIEQAHALILSLNPHPASAFADTHETGCVIAEVLLVKTKEGWKAVLNPDVVARLRFDDETYNLLTQAKLQGKDLADWKARARDARGFVRALEMRYSTITAVAQTIADMQEAFFTEGPKALKPMGLKDIAARLGLSESTVSRAAAGKYLQSPSGTFELKYFFSSALAGDDGQTASAAAARQLIVEAVAKENPAKPLSDAAIAEILASHGIHLARRTVAKYREIEQIPPKSLRKRSS